jgi:DNA-binding GntR family transcriptional regulator
LKIKKPKKKILYSEKAYLQLKKLIFSLKVSPREPVSELKLADLLGMSRTPIREALKRLNIEGIITAYDKRGYFINIPTMKQINDIYGVRMLLECGASRLAASKIDLDQLENFRKQFIMYKKNIDHQKSKKVLANYGLTKSYKGEYNFVKLGREFHFFIIDSTGNERLQELIRNIYDQLEITRIFSYQKRRKEAIDEHLKIVDALLERDGDKAQRYMEDHLRNAFNMVTKIL